MDASNDNITENFTRPRRQECSGDGLSQTIENAFISHASSPADVSFRSNPPSTTHSCHASEKSAADAHHIAISTLSKMDLRKRYAGEANAHRNMMLRQKSKGATINPEFMTFGTFLAHVGPMPTKGCTLDRIDNGDREYGPGKVRWADKHVQNSNKGDTLTIVDGANVFKTSVLAKRQGVTAAAIRRRLSRGWSHEQVIAGSRSGRSPPSNVRIGVSKRHNGTFSDDRASKSMPTETLTKTYVSRSVRPTHARDIQREENRHYAEYYRAEHGEEYFLATPAEMHESIPEHYPPPGVDSMEEATRIYIAYKFPKWWAIHREFVIYANLRPDQQAFVQLVDPEYVARMEHAMAVKAELEKSL